MKLINVIHHKRKAVVYDRSRSLITDITNHLLNTVSTGVTEVRYCVKDDGYSHPEVLAAVTDYFENEGLLLSYNSDTKTFSIKIPGPSK